jgi:FKBP-type peptidyl-prolyl cis-trans isomerase FklB
MKLSIFLPALLLGVLGVPFAAAEPLNLEEETPRINYSLGYQIGGDFKRQGVEMDAEAVIQGIRDALSGAEPQMSQAEMTATLTQLKSKVVADQRKRNIKRELELIKEGEAFMQENAGQEGVITTESGLQYSVTEAGTGKRPGPEDMVTVHYRGTLIDGKPFDSSYKKNKPANFQANRVIKGWAEGLQLMQEGGKYRLFIPPNLAYGGRGPLAHRTLIFDVELLKVGGPPQDMAKPAAAGPDKAQQPDEANAAAASAGEAKPAE